MKIKNYAQLAQNQNPETQTLNLPPLKLFTDPNLLSQLHRNILTRLLEDLEDSLPPEAATAQDHQHSSK